jgi:hypothetical protein
MVHAIPPGDVSRPGQCLCQPASPWPAAGAWAMQRHSVPDQTWKFFDIALQ